VTRSEAHKTVREAPEGSVVKNGEDRPVATSEAGDLRSVVEAMLTEDLRHA
jgi:hypothetical protein